MARRAAIAALVAAAALLPVLPGMPVFWITLLNNIGLGALVALGLVVLTGVGGLTSFGQAAFCGFGAFTTAVLTTRYGWSPWATLPVALAITGVAALVLGLLTLRLSGHYLPLGTIAWGISLYFLFGTSETLGGHTGLTSIPPISIFGYALETGRQIYYLIWLFLMSGVFTVLNLLDSREGRAIRALKGGMVMAESMGVHTAASRMIVFVLAAQMACASGWLYAHMQRFVNPTPFSLHMGIEFLFMAVVGGAGYVWGALLGAAVITVSKTWLQDLLPQIVGQAGNFEVIVFGVLMVVILQRAPDGLWPALTRRIPVRARRRVVRPEEPPL